MKTLTLVFILGLLVLSDAFLIKVPTTAGTSRIAPVGWVHVQKLLLPLFENVCEESQDPTVVRLNEEFKLDPKLGNYLKPDVIDNLLNLKATKGLLEKGQIFTEYKSGHLDELKAVFDVLYYANDFNTFYKAACWARQNLNCGLFVDAVYLALLSRRDTEKISIPPPYELLPNYFVRKDFIIKASSLIRGEEITTDTVRNEGNAYILDVNYTTNFYDDSDVNLAYFHEDVGLNSYYFLTKLKNCRWLNENGSVKNNGQYIYHTLKQLNARYNLERYANGLPELVGIDWDYLNESPYDPMLIYSNGNSFSERMSINNDNELINVLKNMESNLPAVVMHMFKYLQRDNGYNKSEILNHLMEILVKDERSYENLALQILSDSDSDSYSVLEHYITTLRDPIFWKLNKKIIDMVDNALSILPTYTRNQLYIPGVEVQNVEVKKMITSFDNFEFDVTDALKTESDEIKFHVKMSQNRLNHKPFTFKINVASLVAQKALIKIFIGPKVMPGELAKKKNLFMLLDCFETNLKIGSNVITRASNEMTDFSEDLISQDIVYKKVLDTEFGIDALPLKSVTSQIKFPSRLALPKGTSTGLPLQVFVFIAPYIKANVGGSRTNVELNSDAIFSPGYPLDLDIEIQDLFNLPNALVKDIIITHKSESINIDNKPGNNYNDGVNNRLWQKDEIDYVNNQNSLLALAERPAFTKKTFDYKSKKNQYGKRPDYSNKYSEKDKEIKTNEQNLDKNDAISEVNPEPENMEIINNIYITPEISRKVELDTDESQGNGYKFLLDKDEMYNVIHKEVNEDYNMKNKFIPRNEKDVSYKVVVDKDDLNNILHKEVNEEVKSKLNKYEKDSKVDRDIEDKKVIHVYVDKDDKIDNSNQKWTENDVEPHGPLGMPGKKFSNIFNIVFEPQKLDDKVYV
ncbi:arylphorin subunit alpha-like isoform X1 [Danaus plexippus]|uniref:arylphorin subunit alpha-like isoform X1 n=1 Tax=Danaus plexippus TaxID=13037 RepID=UPI002AB1DD76|nr:arylphorin subunit alpha-like isoform X1 [Danaus plexippus]